MSKNKDSLYVTPHILLDEYVYTNNMYDDSKLYFYNNNYIIKRNIKSLDKIPSSYSRTLFSSFKSPWLNFLFYKIKIKIETYLTV